MKKKTWKPFRNYFPVVGASRRPGRNQRTKQLQGTYWKLHNYVQTMGEPMIVGYPRLPLSPLSCGPITYTRESIYIARHGQGSPKLATAIDCTAQRSLKQSPQVAGYQVDHQNRNRGLISGGTLNLQFTDTRFVEIGNPTA